MKLNRQISNDAEHLNTLCNIADRPEVCNFILPSIVRRKDLVITISTSGKSPAMAKKLRKALEKQYGEEYGILLELIPVRPYVELYHRCYREGQLRFFPRSETPGR